LTILSSYPIKKFINIHYLTCESSRPISGLMSKSKELLIVEMQYIDVAIAGIAYID